MAAKKADINVSAMQKIIALLKTRHDEDGALIAELERLAGGGPGIGEILKECYDRWLELWPHGTYVFVFTKDAPQMKRLVRELGKQDVLERMFRYLTCREPFYADKKHPFPMFVATINKWGSIPGEIVFQAAPIGCRHTPPCHSDVEHTRLKQQELRN